MVLGESKQLGRMWIAWMPRGQHTNRYSPGPYVLHVERAWTSATNSTNTYRENMISLS